MSPGRPPASPKSKRRRCSCSTCRFRAPASIDSRSRWTASAKRRCRSPCRRCRPCPPPPLRPLFPSRRRFLVPSPPLGAYVRLPLLVLAAALALAFDLGGYPLFDPDEGRNAEVAREMAQSNDYLLPHLDGLPYLDKPVVYFAAAAAAMEVLGPGETAARLPAFLATLATLGLLVWFARKHWGADAGWIAALALATMPMPLAYARAAIFDSTLSLCTTAAILCFYEERPVLAWAAMGAGALTKGPVALLVPLAAVVPWALLTGGSLRRIFAWRGIAVFAVVALPWFIAVTTRVPVFPQYVFVRETWQRVMTPSFHRGGPWWYFLPILPVAAFPWIVPALAGLRHWRWGWLVRRENPVAR